MYIHLLEIWLNKHDSLVAGASTPDMNTVSEATWSQIHRVVVVIVYLQLWFQISQGKCVVSEWILTLGTPWGSLLLWFGWFKDVRTDKSNSDFLWYPLKFPVCRGLLSGYISGGERQTSAFFNRKNRDWVYFFVQIFVSYNISAIQMLRSEINKDISKKTVNFGEQFSALWLNFFTQLHFFSLT